MLPPGTYISYLLFFIFSLVFSWLVNSLFLKFASTLGIRDKDETVIRWSKTSKPSLGGISFYIFFLLSVVSYSIFFENSRTVLFDKQLLGFIAATTMAFLMGLADDAYNTRPVLKFIVQLLCAAVLIGTGTYIRIFSNIYLDYFLTIVWVVGIMNSINMLDNMDAITTVVSICIILFGLFIEYLDNGFNQVYVLILVGVLGSLLGFLYFNWYPSKMFMGDTGSQFLGIVLSAAGIICFWNAPDFTGRAIPTKQALVTALAFIIPLSDTGCVVINRLLNGRSPFVGGRDHTTHNLFFMGVTERRIAVLFTFISLFSAGLCYLILSIENWNYFYVLLFVLYFLLVFGALFYTVRKKSGTK